VNSCLAASKIAHKTWKALKGFNGIVDFCLGDSLKGMGAAKA